MLLVLVKSRYIGFLEGNNLSQKKKKKSSYKHEKKKIKKKQQQQLDKSLRCSRDVQQLNFYFLFH